ncbi:MAG: uL22 family ribosomal protein [Candidatus Heimdallarchaeaceae archaeon]
MKKIAEAKKPLARISKKDSKIIFDKIRNKQTKKAKQFLNDILNEKRSIDGRYYTKATKQILELIEDAERNAEAKNLDIDKLFIKEANIGKAFRFMLPKSRYSHRGKEAKMCRLSIKVEER